MCIAFMNASSTTAFVISYLYTVFTEVNMMLVRLSGATRLCDRRCADLLVQLMPLSPITRAHLSEGMGPITLSAVHKSKMRAIGTYAEALFAASYPIGLLLEFGAPRSGFHVLSKCITRRGDAGTARIGLTFPRPIHTRDQFEAKWSLTTPLALSPPMECAHPPPASGRCWPLRLWAQCVQFRPTPSQSIDWAHFVNFVVRGEGCPRAGRSWSWLSIGLLNNGVTVRTPAFLWVVGMAVTGDKCMVAVGQIWAQVVQIRIPHLRVHMLFTIWPFINRKSSL